MQQYRIATLTYSNFPFLIGTVIHIFQVNMVKLLFTMLLSGVICTVKYLTDEQGCNPSCLDDLKYTPFYCAAMMGHTDIVKFLTLEKDNV